MIVAAPGEAQERQSARTLGIVTGVLPSGPLNAITDVAGVLVGHTTVVSGDSINTGVTAILSHAGNVFREKVPAAVVVGNGFGKLMGFTQVQELGELESPIVLTCTLCVPRAADAVLTYLLDLPGNEDVRSANAVIGETNDGTLNHIRRRPVSEADVLSAIRGAKGGTVAQGSVGAGRGTVAFGFKGGIGTASRLLPGPLGGWTVGVLVQSNYGGVLTIGGAPVGKELGRYYLRRQRGCAAEETTETTLTTETTGDSESSDSSVSSLFSVVGGVEEEGGDGSIMIVVATDAPLGHRNLERLARRALAGLARTGSSMTNGSGDYVIAFSTMKVADAGAVTLVANDQMSPLFQAVIEATEEAIYNSLLLATTVVGYRRTVEALPLPETIAILERYGVIR
ncbi:MAG: P1 family peptidase [Gemmatimonadota bacterium]|nr:P1 family peptidase [Gemmatimonadota bacterium]